MIGRLCIIICMTLWISGCTTNQMAQLGKGAASYGVTDNQGQAFRADLLTDHALQTVSAVQQERVVAVPDSHLYCSSQYIVNGVYDVAAAAYPQYFRK